VISFGVDLLAADIASTGTVQGGVKATAPDGDEVVFGVGEGHASSSKARQPVPLFSLLAGGDPARGDALRAVSAVAAKC
jgi:hypothetical protein